MMLFLLLWSCSFNTEISNDAQSATKKDIENLLDGKYDAIYENASIEMKNFVSKEIYLNMAILQENMYGKMVDAKVKNEKPGNYQSSATTIFEYELKNKNGEIFSLSTEYLNGHLLKSNINVSEWRKESDFIKNLVIPIKSSIFEQDSKKIFELLEKTYPLEQIESLLKTISETCKDIPSRYRTSWTNNDKTGKMMVAFVYAYEGKGELEYKFYIEKNNYPFAGIYFTPDQNIKLPNEQ
jgi:hypothetical protein